MSWKPIVVGVDGSPESVRAAIVGAMIAQRAETRCVLVSALPDYERLLLSHGMMPNVIETAHAVAAHDTEAIRNSLRGHVPDAMVAEMEISTGHAPVAIAEAAKRLGAELLVVGNKQHRGLDRLRGSTARHLVRTCDMPVLISDGGTPAITRVLAALDLSYASGPTLEAARRWAQLFSAHLRAVHVVEPVPMIPGEAAMISDEYYRTDTEIRATGVWADIDPREVDKVVRVGHAAPTIAREVAEWRADLLVLGSHGRGWVDRLLVGSTTEQLAHRPPALTLVVPVGRPANEALAVGALPWEARETGLATA